MSGSSSYWRERYLNKETGWDIGKVSPPIREYIDQLKTKKIDILIPGAGNAYEAEYLFKNGFKNVFVLDIAAEPLRNFKKRVPEFPDKNLLQQDFFSIQGNYDLVLEQTFFSAIPPQKRPAYVSKMDEILKPGGKLAGVLFNMDFPFEGPPYGGKSSEYRQLFSPVFKIEKFEICYNSIPPRQGNELFFIFKKINEYDRQ